MLTGPRKALRDQSLPILRQWPSMDFIAMIRCRNTVGRLTHICANHLNSYSKQIDLTSREALSSHLERTANRLPIEHHVRQVSVQEPNIEAPGW
jgi:hypothetical protein